MENQPNGIRVEEADKVLKACGYWQIRQKADHRSYINAKGDVIVIVCKNPLKRYQVLDILKRIEKN